MDVNEVVSKCLCGADPIVEKKVGGCLDELFKYRCPDCKEKELPWLGQWGDFGALQEWNRIAPKKSYRKRTLEYNENGACVAEPTMVLEWRAKKGIDHITIEIFEDNGRFYYAYDYWLKNGGVSSGLSISDTGFPTKELLLANVKKRLGKLGRKEGVMKIFNELIPENVQMELF
jgi:hypothetical protein